MIGLSDDFYALMDSEKELVDSLTDYHSLVNTNMVDLIRQTGGDLVFLSDYIRDELSNINTLNKKMASYYYVLVNIDKIYQYRARETTVMIKSHKI